MHELWVDLVQHLLVVVLLKQAFVLLSHPKKGGEDELKWSQSCQFDNSPIFTAGLVDLERLSVHKEDVRQEKLEGLGPAQSQPIQQLLEPLGCFPAVGAEDILVRLALFELA